MFFFSSNFSDPIFSHKSPEKTGEILVMSPLSFDPLDPDALTG